MALFGHAMSYSRLVSLRACLTGNDADLYYRYDIHGFFNIAAKFNTVSLAFALPHRCMPFILHWSQVVDHLTASSQLPVSSNLTLSFASAASIPFALPPLVANGFGWPRWGLGMTGVNQRLKDWLLDCLNVQGEDGDELGVLRGIVPMDFYRKAELVDIMVAFNSRQNAM